MLSLAVGAAAWRTAVPPLESMHSLGSRDFIAFWGGFQAFRQQANPYSRAGLSSPQQAIDPERGPQIFRNPPWSLVLFAPWLWLPYRASLALWLAASCMLFMAAGPLAALYFRRTTPPGPLALAAYLLSPAAFYCLQMGQMTLFLGAALIGFFLSLQAGRDRSAGVMLALLAAKPHLFGPIVLFPLLALPRRRLLRLASAAGMIVGAGSAAAWWWRPSVFHDWLHQDLNPLIVRTSTLVSMLRLSAAVSGAGTPVWPVIVVPLAGMAAVGLLFLHRPQLLRDAVALPLLIVLALCFAPYAMPYDFCLLIPVTVYLTGIALTPARGRARSLRLLAVFTAALSPLLASPFVPSLDWLFFVPWLHLALIAPLALRAARRGMVIPENRS